MLNKLVFIISFIGRNHWHNHGFYCRACLVMANAFGCRDGLFHNILLMHLLKQNMIISSSTCKSNANFCILQKNHPKICARCARRLITAGAVENG